MKDFKALLDLMFLPDDTICVGDSHWAYHSMPVESVLSGEVTLLSPNPKVKMKKVKSDKLTHLAINPVNGFRNDSNVYRIQNFLWEIDVGSLSSQLSYMRSIGLPYSAAVFSGNKSIHFVTVLDEPIDIKTYRLLYAWALAVVTLCDKACKNPTRCVRIPGAVRPDTDRVQKLIEIKGKVKLDDFMAWLNQYEHLRPKERGERKGLTNEGDYEKLSPWARSQFRDGIDFSGGRNRAFFSLACDMFNSGYSEFEALEILEQYFVEEHDFKYKEFATTINSAYKYMANKI